MIVFLVIFRPNEKNILTRIYTHTPNGGKIPYGLWQAPASPCQALFNFPALLAVCPLKGQKSLIYPMITWPHAAFYIPVVKNEWPQNCREVNLFNNLSIRHGYIEICSVSGLHSVSHSLSLSLSPPYSLVQWETSISMSLPVRSCLNKVIGFDL